MIAALPGGGGAAGDTPPLNDLREPVPDVKSGHAAATRRRFRYHAVTARGDAQTTLTAHFRRVTIMTIRRLTMRPISMHTLFATLALSLASLAGAAPLGAQGTLRELFCRGASGINLRVDLDPSPRDTADVVMVLEYKRPTTPPGNDVHRLEPGTCTWNPLGVAGVPVEPGRVRFDVRREAQRWSDPGTRSMDTTKRAAVFFPDPITLPRYLGDPNSYWKFFVNDATNLSTSYGALFESGVPTYVTIKGPVVLANDVRRDLLCRGGSAGLLYGGGTNAGDNLSKVLLTYRVSQGVPGPSGLGLSPGSCAWIDRTAMPAEPGAIAFITARNAQLKQTQSGSAVDRTPTAAERYPDVNTIPEYLKDPAHYWRFTVASRDPDSALTNGVWKRDLTSTIATTLPAAGPPVRSAPTTIPGGGDFRPGGAGTTTSITSVFDIKNVVVSPTLDNLVIGFQAAPNIVPVVTVTPAAGGPSVTIPVQGSAQGTMWRYVGSSKTPLARNTRYNYAINAPASGNARANSASGAFKTLGQSVTVAFTEIYLVSDGDADSNGELVFQAQTCPQYLLKPFELGTVIRNPLGWGDGPHRIDEKMTSYKDTVPDRFRVVVFGLEDDRTEGGAAGVQSYPYQHTHCTGNGPEPGRNSDWEWNSIMLDFDLTRYPGANGGEQFYKRAKPLRNGSSLAFEVRGYIQVTRQ